MPVQMSPGTGKTAFFENHNTAQGGQKRGRFFYSRSKDMILKLYKYKNAGVREYWVVDSKNRIVIVYRLEA